MISYKDNCRTALENNIKAFLCLHVISEPFVIH